MTDTPDNPEDLVARARRTATMVKYQGHLMSQMDMSALVDELADEIDKLRIVRIMEKSEDGDSIPAPIKENDPNPISETTMADLAPLVAALNLAKGVLEEGKVGFKLRLNVMRQGGAMQVIRISWIA